MPSCTTISSGDAPRVLCVAPSWLGDAVLARPALARLGRSGVQVAVWARPRVVRALEDLPGVRIAATMPASRPARYAWAWQRRAARDAAALVLPPSWSASVAARLTGASVRVGFASGARGALFSHAVAPVGRRVHLAEQYETLVLALLAEVGLPAAAAAPPPPLVAHREERDAARALLDALGVGSDYVVLLPGARYGPSKRWPAERFAAAARRIAADWRCAVVLCGEASDAEATAAVQRALPEAVDLAGRTPAPALLGVLAGSRGVVSNDSGGMHLAAALGRPVVGVFGSSTPEWTAPLGPAAVAVVQPVWCAPCFAPVCREDFACMTGIAPERVARALEGAARTTAGVAAERRW